MKLYYCKHCQEWKVHEDLYILWYRDRGRFLSRCKVCSSKQIRSSTHSALGVHNQRARREANTKRYCETMFHDGKPCCMICRGEFPWPVYDFHHLKPAEKKVQMSDAIRARWEVMEKEMYKCILVCVNCHRMIHRCPKELWVNKSTKKE